MGMRLRHVIASLTLRNCQNGLFSSSLIVSPLIFFLGEILRMCKIIYGYCFVAVMDRWNHIHKTDIWRK